MHFFNISTSKTAPRPTCFDTFTSKCALRHNRLHFFNISTSKTAPKPTCFDTFYFKMCFAPQRRYDSKCRSMTCNFPFKLGGLGWVPHGFVPSLAMGERRCSTPPSISWTSYSNTALLQTIQQITVTLQQREHSGESATPAASSEGYSVQPPLTGTAGTSAEVGGQPLQKPWSCGFTCRWCQAACTRREGHSFHSCYEHRHRR